MQVIRYLVVGFFLAAPGEVLAKNTQALVISLDVPEDRAPDWLCVVATESCKDASSCLAAELPDLGLEPHRDWRFGFEAAAPSRKLPLPVDAALRALRRPELSDRDNLCSREDQNGCRPEVDLRQFRTVGTPAHPSSLSGRVVCGARPGTRSGTPEPGKIRRVAFIGLTFGDPLKDTSGIQEINFVGTTANVTFERPLSRETVTFAQVVGGDYAPSEASAIGDNENVLVKLRPRCSRFVAELPGHVAPIGAVSIRGESLDLKCSAPKTSSRTLALEVPYASTSDEKELTVELATVPASVSEARWTEALPPVPLRLGVRSLQFSWQRPIGCLADRWSEPTPADEKTWSQSCPRATLSDSTICEVLSKDPPSPEAELPTCEYQCTIDARFDSPRLPIPVRFDRIRTKDAGARTEIIYSWSDQVTFSGQTLTSTVAPIDRRVMLEFSNPFGWNDSWGDRIDAIQIATGRSSEQIDLTGRPPGQPLPRWISLATPGRTCSDRVRVTVIGTRPHDEKTFEVDRGRIALRQSLEFRSRAHGYVVLGGGSSYEEVKKEVKSDTSMATAMLSERRSIHSGLDLSIGFQIGLPGSLSVNTEVLGRLFFASRVDENDVVTGTPFVQGELRIGLEWLIFRRFSIAGLVGLGLGTAVFASDRKGRAYRFSSPVEVDPMIFTVWPRRLWLLWGVGLRFHEDYVLPVCDPGQRGFKTEPFLVLGLRGLLG